MQIGQALLHLDSLPVHLILPLQISLVLSLHCLCLLLRIHRPPWHHLHLQAATDTSASLELWRLALCIGSMDKRTFLSFRAVSYVLTSKAKLLSKMRESFHFKQIRTREKELDTPMFLDCWLFFFLKKGRLFKFEPLERSVLRPLI